VGNAVKNLFDPKVFLAKVGAGKTILEFHKNQKVFAQGDVADTIFYIQKGRIKLTVLSEQGKEAVVGILEPGQFFGEGCMNGHPLNWLSQLESMPSLCSVNQAGTCPGHLQKMRPQSRTQNFVTAAHSFDAFPDAAIDCGTGHNEGSAWGPDADRHAKLLIHFAAEGSLLDAYSQTESCRFVLAAWVG
jgi:hypothetical protein